MFVVIVELPDGRVDAVGPFKSNADAAMWEDRELDVLAGSRAHITIVQDPEHYKA